MALQVDNWQQQGGNCNGVKTTKLKRYQGHAAVDKGGMFIISKGDRWRRILAMLNRGDGADSS